MNVQLRSRADATEIMTTGGDARIVIDPATGLNRYHSAPRPSEVLAYASSTANDISAAAFEHVEQVLAAIGPEPSADAYAAALEALRSRIRAAYGLDQTVAIVFAPSGTDLEYVALAAAAGKATGGTHNILLGADEVGSGCIHSAHGRYFAEATALGVATKAGEPVPGLDSVRVDLVDIPVRDEAGRVRHSDEIAARMAERIAAAKAARRHTLVHVVHGSKTGLILPALPEIESLQARYGAAITLVVDACQARITTEAVQDYLADGAIVFVTGSKFMGGPPFSGFALVPRRLAAQAMPLPEGLATIFRRAEWPAEWPGVERLSAGANVGLLLRLEASIFELERFQALPAAEVERVVLAFHAAVRAEIIERTPARRGAPYPPGDKMEADTHPVEMRTLSTLDLSAFGNDAGTFEDAQRWHKSLLAHGVRLGQPVKCVRLPDGAWGATLRIGLAMWQVVDRVEMSDDALTASFAEDIAKIREALVAVAA
jgi:selenocysteine lyase/cysteine desulfurase